MKTYPHLADGSLDPAFLNETRFSGLQHRNVIGQIQNVVSKRAVADDGSAYKMSYILMEYAPYGDLFDALRATSFNEKLCRTYFHQMINALDHLHQRNVFHLDIKLENLMLGNEYQLKICDFDLSIQSPQEKINHCGTANYRAPEIAKGSCSDAAAADVYSAAVVLFVLRTRGYFPQYEDEEFAGHKLYDLLAQNPSEFWEVHRQILKKSETFFSNEFKQLFEAMTKVDPSKRATLKQVKESSWFKGETFTEEELTRIMASKL
jgi:serine/threonine protein kinase